MIILVLLMLPFVFHSLYVMLRHFTIWMLTTSHNQRWQLKLVDISHYSGNRRWRYQLSSDVAKDVGWIKALIANRIMSIVDQSTTKKLLAGQPVPKLNPDIAPVEAGSWK